MPQFRQKFMPAGLTVAQRPQRVPPAAAGSAAGNPVPG
jgi:hypothetical protein